MMSDKSVLSRSLDSNKYQNRNSNKNEAPVQSITKLRSFLPKVLLHDNQGLDNKLRRSLLHLNTEQKRATNYWTHSQKEFIVSQAIKEMKTGLCLFPQHMVEDLPAFTEAKHRRRLRHNNEGPEETGSEEYRKLPAIRRQRGCPLDDPRFKELEKSLLQYT